MQGTAGLTHRPLAGNKLLRPEFETKINIITYKRTSKREVNLNRGDTNPNESTNAKGDYI